MEVGRRFSYDFDAPTWIDLTVDEQPDPESSNLENSWVMKRVLNLSVDDNASPVQLHSPFLKSTSTTNVLDLSTASCDHELSPSLDSAPASRNVSMNSGNIIKQLRFSECDAATVESESPLVASNKMFSLSTQKSPLKPTRISNTGARSSSIRKLSKTRLSKTFIRPSLTDELAQLLPRPLSATVTAKKRASESAIRVTSSPVRPSTAQARIGSPRKSQGARPSTALARPSTASTRPPTAGPKTALSNLVSTRKPIQRSQSLGGLTVRPISKTKQDEVEAIVPFRARALDRRVLESTGQLGVPRIEKKAPTVPRSPRFASRMRTLATTLATSSAVSEAEIMDAPKSKVSPMFCEMRAHKLSLY